MKNDENLFQCENEMFYCNDWGDTVKCSGKRNLGQGPKKFKRMSVAT